MGCQRKRQVQDATLHSFTFYTPEGSAGQRALYLVSRKEGGDTNVGPQ